MSCKRVFEWEDPNSSRPKKLRQMKTKVKSMPIIFFDIKRTVQEEFVLAIHTLGSTYYCDVLWQLHKNV
jgi:hypothetical protein